MTLNAGARIRTLVDLLTTDGSIVPIGTAGTVIGYAGERLVVSFEDRDTGETLTAECQRWEVRPA